jgi:DNA-binding NarL/FixJ family response regulator
VRIFCCDDSRSFLLLLEDWFQDHDDVDLVGTASTRGDALERLPDAAVDAVVTDTFAPFGDAAFLHALRSAASGACLVLYTGYAPTQLTPDVAAAVDAVVQKGADESELVRTLRALVG